MINPKVACGVWCALIMFVSGQDATPNSGDRLAAETTTRLLEFDKNNDRGGPRRPMSPEMLAISRNPDLLNNLGAEDLAKMTLDDPLLKWAYACVFTRSWHLKQLAPPQELALADMRRRGEEVSPMLLKLISENQEHRIEFAVLGQIGYLDTVRIEPFLEYARRLLRERVKTMTANAAGSASYLLGRHGTREDEALLEWVINERPYVTYTITEQLKTLRARLDPPSETRPERREIPSSDSGRDARVAVGAEDHPQAENSATSQTKPWLIGGMILVVLLGLYRLLRKSQRGQSS